MAIKLGLGDDGITSAGTLSYRDNPNVQRLFLVRIQVLEIPASFEGASLKFRARFWSSNPGGSSTIRWRINSVLDTARTTVEINREVGGTHLIEWPFGANNWDTVTPWATLALRLPGAPGAGADLWVDGTKITKASELNASGSYEGGATGISYTDADCIGNSAIGDNTRGMHGLYSHFRAWLGQDAYASGGNFLIPDAVAAALSRGVSPQSLGMPLPDIGYEFGEDGEIRPVGKSSISAIQDQGFQPGEGLYRVWPTAIIGPTNLAEPSDTLAATINSPCDDALTAAEASIEALGAALNSPCNDAATALEAGVDALPVALNSPCDDAVTTATISVSALTLVVNSPCEDVETNIQAAIVPDGLEAAINSPCDDAITTLAVQVASLEAALASPCDDALTAIQASIGAVTLLEAAINSLCDDAVTAVVAGVATLEASIDSPCDDVVTASPTTVQFVLCPPCLSVNTLLPILKITECDC